MHNQLFPSQREGEKILLVVREHWFRLFIKLLVIVILAALPFIITALLGNNISFLDTPEARTITLLLLQLYYIVLLIALFVIWILYYLNIHIVSEERIVDIDQVSLLNHVVSELNVETIEDVTGQTTGLFGNLLDYGTVYVQTAGARERFEFDNVPNPGHIAKIILDVYENHVGRENPKP